MKGDKSNYRAPWVAYVGPFKFPDGGAAARRVLGNALSLLEAGYEVTIASGQQLAVRQDSELFDSITVVSLGERTVEHWPRALRRIAYAGMGRRTRAWLEAQEPPPAAIILYSGYTPYLLRLLPWCRRMEIPLIFDAVEWYEASGFLGPLVSPYQWNIDLAMRWLIKKSDGVIAISNFLAEYYRNAGLPVLKIPPTLSVEVGSPTDQSCSDSRLHLCYAGIPTGNKDLLDVVLAAVVELDKDGERIELHIAGPTEQELMSVPSLAGRYAGLPPCIRSHGKLSHDSAVKLVGQCDFTVLLRRNHRVSRAGFSTKFVESLACGTPVIGNHTGDLGEFLLDGETGLVCDGWTVMDLKKTLNRALLMTKLELQQMRDRSRKMAVACFDYHVYSEVLGSFVKNIAK